MKNLLEKNDLLKPPKIGDIIEGKTIGKGRSTVFLDLGPIGTGIIYGKEFYDAKEKLKDLKTGDKIFAKIIDFETEDGYIELSVSGASKELTFGILKQKKEEGETIKVKILGANKGGLLAEVSGIPAFLPVSQLSSEHYPKVEGGDKAKILRELQKFIGQELEVKILDFSQKKEQIILSEKAKVLDKARERLKNYKVGDEIKGEITGVTGFGAFMKFDENLEGLIHISELDWKIIEDPTEIVKVGDKVRAKIVEISGNRSFLSLKALKKDPWEGIEKKYKKEDIVLGKVTKLNPFGAFIQLSKEIQGLCHVSEFGGKKMEDILETGKKYKFQILLVDEKEHRMNLKLIKE
ncbi:MAG: 30S ribosomal protein S1 [Candidatus Paceibacterales bacterium]